MLLDHVRAMAVDSFVLLLSYSILSGALGSQRWSSSVMLCNNSSIAYNYQTNNNLPVCTSI